MTKAEITPPGDESNRSKGVEPAWLVSLEVIPSHRAQPERQVTTRGFAIADQRKLVSRDFELGIVADEIARDLGHPGE